MRESILASVLLLAACAPATSVANAPVSTIAAAPTGATPATAVVAQKAPTANPADVVATATRLPGATAPVKALALTPALTEGPFYKASPPQRSDLREPNTRGETLLLTGRVVDAQGQPIANAKVDIWHDDETGKYDNTGYKYRGYVLTDANGDYNMTTITPALYPGRTWHIHVKIIQPGGKTLTTQLFSAGYTLQNAEDGIFNAKMLGTETTTPQGRQLAYTFVVARA